MKYAVFGSNGQLGKEIISLLTSKNIECHGYDLPEYNIGNFLLMSKLINLEKPNIIINCAAYNDVDTAELYFENAYLANAAGVENLAIICKRENIKLVHYSTNYIFDGHKKLPGLYTENDTPQPINNYGSTKLQGENIALTLNPDTLILRTSWLYGDGQNNFVHKVLNWCEEQKHLKIVNDEFATPTSAKLVAKITLQAINNNLTGVYNIVNTGYCSRYEWAQLIIKLFHKDVIVYPASMKEFAVIAKRPAFAALNNKKICKALQIEIPHWKPEFVEYVKNIENQQNNYIKTIRNDVGIVNI